jgi:hypothetical protein
MSQEQPIQPTGADYAASLPTPTAPPPITINDLLNSVEVLTKKESDDKATLESIGKLGSDILRGKLLSWAIAAFPNSYEIYKIVITPPTLCSDGVSRNLSEYILFCSGKTLLEHVAVLQAKVTGMKVMFVNTASHISIVVSKV